MSSVVVHYSELALKGRNRPWFIHMLVRTIRAALAGLGVTEVRPVVGRIVIQLEPGADWESVRARLSRLPGIGNFALATHVPADLDVIGDRVVASVAGRTAARSFRIAARRADKRFPTPSPEIERVIGRRVQDATGWPVNLSAPALVIRVEVLTHDAFFFVDREEGTGGLPVGTGGRVLALLSGGIDSPVAAWRLIRRGCRADMVHFHSYPILSRTSQDKVRVLAARLTECQLRSRLYLVPFGGLQQQVVVGVAPALRVVVYRRLMMRIAERLAERTSARALVTGDSVGQVASQTIDNLAVVGSVVALPVLRPLVGMDKAEITRDAERLGTYSTSIIPDDDCCTLFTPPHPATRASRTAVEAAEARLDIDRFVERALAETTVEDLRFPMLEFPTPNQRTTAGERQ
jgi:thiamine biosynthesis protein ThiI